MKIKEYEIVDEEGRKSIKEYPSGVKVIALVEPSEEYLAKLQAKREASKQKCKYCGQVFYADELELHEPECRMKTFQSLRTLEEKLNFIAKELGLI